MSSGSFLPNVVQFFIDNEKSEKYDPFHDLLIDQHFINGESGTKHHRYIGVTKLQLPHLSQPAYHGTNAK
ncbi:hypothetical protein JTE90_011502 [Oedothorax gibbosus]|uniref:Uncharacterized protein n=1 Tax=Oedothorax gibbosus TaxID=931172 RepID=A0AAV6VD41_9ARAC|nr:hypothetical protein JTE90_011502 [Oedothorax gibbosus]